MARIVVVGTGYVGLTTGSCFAELGHQVRCLDIDAAKIERLNAGDVPIFEPGLTEIVVRNLEEGRLRFTTSYSDALEGAEFVFIAVGTPPSQDGHSVEMKYVDSATREIGRNLTARAIIINKSTSPIGTAGRIVRILESTNPGLAPWTVVSNPEFLREGSAVEDCLHPARVVLGAETREDADAVARLYHGFGCPVIVTDLNSAEMIKYASNAFLATRISFINEVARICDALGADVMTVAEGMGLDPRIGRDFLRAGLGYGGSCFPKDVAALKHMAAGAGLHPQLLSAVTDINDDQRRWIVQRMAQDMEGLAGKVIGLWGIAFKPNTDDIRDAPAVDVAQRLVDLGATVRAFDPVVSAAPLEGTFHGSAFEAAKGADALIVATEWDDFLTTDWRALKPLMRGDVILDARNCLNRSDVEAAGFRYVGVGRSGLKGRHQVTA